MGLAMVLFAGLCILLGVMPELLYRFLPYPVDYAPYTAGKVLFYLQLLMFSGLAFFLLLPLMQRTLTVSLDFDWLWRVLFFRLGNLLFDSAARLRARFDAAVVQMLNRWRSRAQRYLGVAEGEQRPGILARAWPIGVTAIWIAVLLSGYVFVYYF
jgi:multicomponent Na+:H+ antiporter subunit D